MIPEEEAVAVAAEVSEAEVAAAVVVVVDSTENQKVHLRVSSVSR